MGNVAAEIFVLLLGGTAVLSLVVSSVTDCWRQDAKDPHSSVGLSSRCRGLWSECVFDNMANLWTCDIPVSYLNDHPASHSDGDSALHNKRDYQEGFVTYARFPEQPLSMHRICVEDFDRSRSSTTLTDYRILKAEASFVIARAMMVVQGVFCIVALPILIIGMKCTTFVNKKCHKSRFSISSGILFLLGGLSGGVASFWYAVDTVLKYRLEVGFGVPGVTYELGYSYWMTAAGTICASTSGMILIGMKCTQNKMDSRRKCLSSQKVVVQQNAGLIYM